MELKKVAEEQEIWDEEEKVAKSKEEAKKIVSECFHKQIHIFGKKASEKIPTRKLWDHVKKKFMPRKGKVYPLLREKRGDAQFHF